LEREAVRELIQGLDDVDYACAGVYNVSAGGVVPGQKCCHTASKLVVSVLAQLGSILYGARMVSANPQYADCL